MQLWYTDLNMDIKDSDSDVSDGWSVVDAAAQSENGSVKDESDDESINSNASDGESLEIIQEEIEERKQFIENASDAENDCCSAISNCSSMIEEAASDSIEWNSSKLQTYVHHRNCLLNARLNFVVIVAVAAVAGLGIGHFIGSQEDCPSLPNIMPDISVDSVDITTHKDADLDFNPYFRQSLIGNVLKAKRIKQIQQRYRRFEDSFCAIEDKVRHGECSPNKQNFGNIHFVNQNQNIDVEVKKLTGQHHTVCSHQVSKDGACVEVHEAQEVKLGSQNNIHNINSNKVSELKQPQFLHQDCDIAEKSVKLDNIIQDIAVNIQDTSVQQIENVYQDTRGSPEEERMELEHSLDQNILYDYSKICPVQSPNTLAVNQDSHLPPKEFIPEEFEKGISTKEAKALKKGLYETFDKGIHTDMMDDAYVEVSSDYDTSFGDYTETSVDYVGEVGNSNTYRDDLLQQASNGIREHSDVTSELEKQTDEQLPWLKRFSDTVQNIHLPSERKLISIVDLLVSLKQSIVELEKTIVTNESSKFLKKMKMSVNKMKETMERIQKEASTWSLKTAEKMHHRLLKLKSKVQEKWCDIKDKYHQDANIFGWLKNNLFQDCQTNEGPYHMKPTRDTSDPIDFGTENNIKQTQKSEGKRSEKSFDRKVDGNNKVKHEDREGNPHKFRTTENYGFARNGPNSASHDYRQSAKGAFDKLRQNSMICPPHCKHEHGESNHMDLKEKWMFARKVAADWKDSNNVSGIWMLRMSQGRAESRRNDQKSDWLFERARARKLKRDTDHERTNWYFDRAQKRDNCRLNPRSDWCLGVKHSVQEQNKYSYDHFDTDDDDDEDDDDGDERQDEYFRPKFWSKKIPSAPFAKTGKWLKNTVKDFKQKMNYYQYNQHKFHYV